MLTGNLSAELIREDAHQRQVLDIAVKLRCAVCQSQSVGESDSELAVEMKAIIGEQLVDGRSEAEIIDYFVQRYGDYILMKPRADGVGSPLWLAPVMVVLLFILVVGWQIGRRAKPANVENQISTQVDQQQRSRLQQLRDKQK
ncbi:MAG: cytochrome c-type biogenesis protein CcmH [Immundisolibacteraceae bacterium]|nr:cytochrome c-type biogenesis protein CcmH [Immundisolibacteraceae bacterium]